MKKISLLLIIAVSFFSFSGCALRYPDNMNGPGHHSVYRENPNRNTALWSKAEIKAAPPARRREMMEDNRIYTINNSREAARTAKEWAYAEKRGRSNDVYYRGADIFNNTANQVSEDLGHIIRDRINYDLGNLIGGRRRRY